MSKRQSRQIMIRQPKSFSQRLVLVHRFSRMPINLKSAAPDDAALVCVAY
jgi:hypothetical protein